MNRPISRYTFLACWLYYTAKGMESDYTKICAQIESTSNLLPQLWDSSGCGNPLLPKIWRSKHIPNIMHTVPALSGWRHQTEIFSALLAICAGNSPVPDEFPAQRPVTRSFDVYFDLRPNKRLSKQSWDWWFETPSHPYDVIVMWCFVVFR